MKEKERILDNKSSILRSKKIAKKNSLQEKGITLIALVVTVIILLILAGVTISQITGENGIFKRTKEAAEKYKKAGEDEEVALQQLGQYLTNFSVVGDEDNSKPEEEKSSVKITGLSVVKEGTNSIKVTVATEGEVSKIEYSINNGENWVAGIEPNIKEYTFSELQAGSYFIRVKAYDKESKYTEAISKALTINAVTTAEVGDVLDGKTFEKDGKVIEGTMPNLSRMTQNTDAVVNGNTVTMTIPRNGFYDTSSELRCDLQLYSEFTSTFNNKTDGRIVNEGVSLKKGKYNIVYTLFGRATRNTGSDYYDYFTMELRDENVYPITQHLNDFACKDSGVSYVSDDGLTRGVSRCVELTVEEDKEYRLVYDTTWDEKGSWFRIFCCI